MGSARYVARRIAFGRVTRVVIVFAGIVASFGDASIAVVDHVTFVYRDHHRFVFEVNALTGASTLSSTHRARSPRMACGIGAMAASKSKSGKVFLR